jgi:hypothetical protein
MSSDGCIVLSPIPIHLVASFLVTPIPGIKTATRRTKAIINEIVAHFLYIL